MMPDLPVCGVENTWFGSNSAAWGYFTILIFSKALSSALRTSFFYHHFLWPFLERITKHAFWNEQISHLSLCPQRAENQKNFSLELSQVLLHFKKCISLKNFMDFPCIWFQPTLFVSIYTHNYFRGIHFPVHLTASNLGIFFFSKTVFLMLFISPFAQIKRCTKCHLNSFRDLIKVPPLFLILSVSLGCILIWESVTDWKDGKQETILVFHPTFWALYITSKFCLKSVQLFSEFSSFFW